MKMKFLKFGILVLVVCPMATYGQDCDSSSDKAPCVVNELCWNKSCIAARRCASGSECGGTPGTLCVSDFCQADPCTATGQCVTGHVCSQNTNRACVYPIQKAMEAGQTNGLIFEKTAAPGPYEDMSWWKGSTDSSDRIVLIHPTITNGKTLYYNDYCSGVSPCETSEKVSLNNSTGVLTIDQVALSDEGLYYYKFYAPDSIPLNSGSEFEYQIEVFVQPKDPTLEGIPNELVGVGEVLTLNCTVGRIKPLPSRIYWTISGTEMNGTLSQGDNSDGTSWQTSIIPYNVTREDKEVKCTVDPQTDRGTDVFTEGSINIGYGPTGQPDLKPKTVPRHVNQSATLTCNNPSGAGNPGNPTCSNYTWTKLEENVDDLPKTQTYKFEMDESHAGNYTCRCSNQFGLSDESEIARVILLEGPPLPTPSPHDGSGTSGGGSNAAIIGGAVGGAVVLIVLVVVIVIFILRRRNKPKSIPDDENRMVHKNGSAKQPEEPTYAQPDKTRKLRPHRGIRNDGKGIDGPQYMNTKEIQGEGENPYENTQIDNNNPPAGKQENGVTPEVVYTEVKIGENGVRPVIPGRPGTKPKPKPKPTERTSVKKPKINQNEEPTVYAEIKPQPLVKKDEEN